MRVIEFFSGTQSISQAFSRRGHKTLSLDFSGEFDPDIIADMLYFDVSELPKDFRAPAVVWCSPPCTTFSCMTISRNFRGGRPITSKSYIGLALALKSVELIRELKPKFWFIENPRGMLRKQHFMDMHRKTVTYCQYGERYQKPTDIWTNAISWSPKKPCSSGDGCHEAAGRGSRAGIQQLSNAMIRGRIPELLAEEIVDICEGKLKEKQEVLK